MPFPRLTIICASLVVGFAPLALPAQSLLESVFEGFESGTKSAVGPLRWTSSAGNPVVSTDWAATGRYSLKFPYVATSENEDDFVEQRFALSTGTPDLWIRFKIRVPDGYSHRDVPGSDNNKFFKISTNGDVNSSEGVNLMWELWPTSGGGSLLAYHWTNPGVETGTHKQATYVYGPNEAGQVLEFVLRAKMSSRVGVNDGIVQTWFRRVGTAAYKQIHDERNAPMYPASSWSDQRNWISGYVLGWANSSFGRNTTYYIDDLEMSSTSLLGGVAPNPPSALTIQ